MNNQGFSYYNPVKVIFGEHSLAQLPELVAGRKVLLVTTSGTLKRGLPAPFAAIKDRIVHTVDDIQSHPEFNDLRRSYEAMANIDFEVIVAIGGGSVLDAAKVFSVYGDHQGFDLVDSIIRTGKSGKHYRTKPIIAIPTTAGTGSEITPWATVWDMQEKKKYSLHLPELFAETAIYDGALTLSLSREVTIQTGLDTLSHALESVWNKNASEVTVRHAVQSIKLVMACLPQLADDLSNLDYRHQMMRACMYAGLAFSNTQTAIAHSMSYYITANKGVPHGIACSFTLPAIARAISGRYAFVDEALAQALGDNPSDALQTLFEQLNISTAFEDYGVSAGEFEQLLGSLANSNRIGNSLLDAGDFTAF